MEFESATQFFVHLSRQLVMGRGIGMKRHRDDHAFDGSFQIA